MFSTGPGLREVLLSSLDPADIESAIHAYLPDSFSREEIHQMELIHMWDERRFVWETAPFPFDHDWIWEKGIIPFDADYTWEMAPMSKTSSGSQKRRAERQSHQQQPSAKWRGGRPEQRIYNELIAAKRSLVRLLESPKANDMYIDAVKREIIRRECANEQYKLQCESIRAEMKASEGKNFRIEMCHDDFRILADKIHAEYGLTTLSKLRV